MSNTRPVDPAAFPFHDAQAAVEFQAMLNEMRVASDKVRLARWNEEYEDIRRQIRSTRRGRVGLALIDAYLSVRRRIRRLR